MMDGVCCFCGRTVERSGLNPCTLSIVTAADESQEWPCHARCLRERMAELPYADGLISDERL